MSVASWLRSLVLTAMLFTACDKSEPGPVQTDASVNGFTPPGPGLVSITEQPGSSCRSVSFVASRTYSPSRWSDASSSFQPNLRFSLPAEIVVTTGNAGNKQAILTITNSSGAVMCTYRGGATKAHPTDPADIERGRKYLFAACAPTELVAGSAVDALMIVLHVQNGDHKDPAGATVVSLTVEEPPPCDDPCATLDCDDHNPCTRDSCSSIGCAHEAIEEASPCGDGDACNGIETCDASGQCVVGSPPSLDDENPCTQDTCDPATGVVHAPLADGTGCDDSNLCTHDDACQEGACVGGSLVTCVAENACHDVGTCDETTGVCSNPAKPAGSACGDGDVCSGVPHCDAEGQCVPGAPAVVDDNDPCTTDACHPVAGVTHTRIADCVPDPALLAPPLDLTATTPFLSKVDFLYEGANPIQTGVDPEAIDPRRVAVIRGRVVAADGSALAGVTVRAFRHDELGLTRTRADGAFDLVVNGGGKVIVQYTKSDYLEVHRDVLVPWQDFVVAPDVALVALDSIATEVSLDSPTEVQVAHSTPQTDDDGTRAATLFFLPGTQAAAVLPDGSTVPLDVGTIRATEYTVGANGALAMPGRLPVTSGYTYAVELSVDEARDLGATTVEFNRPVYVYIDNFLGFPVGWPMPSGFYDREIGQWAGLNDGRVIAVVDTAGPASVDWDGDGAAESDERLAAVGLSVEEREALSENFPAGTTLWRMPVEHFTPVDFNARIIPDPPDPPQPDNPEPPDGPDPDPDTMCGSVIECQNQFLSERLPLVGIPFGLRYSSDRVPGYRAAHVLDFPIGAAGGSERQSVFWQVSVAGRSYSSLHRADQSPGRAHVEWDGKDAYGRAVQGSVPARISIVYCYPGIYVRTYEEFVRGWAGMGAILPGVSLGARIGGGVPGTSGSGGGGGAVCFTQSYTKQLGHWNAVPQALGSWSLEIHHNYDPMSQTLYRGDGQRTQVAGYGPVAKRLLHSQDGFSFGEVAHVKAMPDGSIYFAEHNGRHVMKLDADDKASVLAGVPWSRDQSYVDGPGDVARFAGIRGMAIDSEGNIYVSDADNHRIRKVTPMGLVSTLYGNGTATEPIAGASAINSSIGRPGALARLADGSFIFYEDEWPRGRLWQITSEGRLVPLTAATFVGVDPPSGPVNNVKVGDVWDIAQSPSGETYFCQNSPIRLLKITTEGEVRVVAGGGNQRTDTDGIAATELNLDSCNGLVVDAADNVYFAEVARTLLHRVAADGTHWRVLGKPSNGSLGPDGAPARETTVGSLGVDIAPDGALIVGSGGRLTRVKELDGWALQGEVAVPNSEGSEVYIFDEHGRHLRTLDAMTKVLLYSFAYDDGGRLTRITDTDGLVTRIERSASGDPVAVVSPYGARTTLVTNTLGQLVTLRSPAGEEHHVEYTAGGLMTLLRDPRGGEHYYDYDELGRLVYDERPGGGFVSLARSGDSVKATTSESRSTQYTTSRDRSDKRTYATIEPSGLVHGRAHDNGRTIMTSADGVTMIAQPLSDARFGMRAPTYEETTTLPSLLTRVTSHRRTAILGDPSNPLSFTSLVDVLSVNGRQTISTYTEATATRTTVSPAGRTASTTYNAKGRAQTSSVSGLANTLFDYDEHGRLQTVVRGPREVVLDYDNRGRLSSVTNALQQTTEYVYDENDRVRSIFYSDGSSIDYTWDGNGNLTSLTPPGQPGHFFTYNPDGLLLSYKAPPVANANSTETLFSYNSDKELITVTRPDGTVLHHEYDTSGRLRRLASAQEAYELGYNTLGQLTTINRTDGANLAFMHDGDLPTSTTWKGDVQGTVSQAFDADFRVGTITVNDDSVSYGYDDDGLITTVGAMQLTYDDGNGLLSTSVLGQLTTRFTQDELGEHASEQTFFLDDQVYAEFYVRDNGGRIVNRTVADAGGQHATAYTYDLHGRLTDVVRDELLVEHYEYDRNGNRTVAIVPSGLIEGTYDSQDRMLSFGDVQYTYSDSGHLIAKAEPIGTTEYAYDGFANLRSVKLPNGASISYVLDALDRRVGKTVDGVLKQGFLYDVQDRVVAELDGSNNVVSRFVYASHPHAPSFMVKGGTTYRILVDHVGSPVMVVDISSGLVAQVRRYDSFGNVLGDSAPGFQPFGFAGGLEDGDTGLLRFGRRDYDPRTGRWTSKDPIDFASNDTNLYRYASGDPVNRIDIDGLNTIPLPLPIPVPPWVAPVVFCIIAPEACARAAEDLWDAAEKAWDAAKDFAAPRAPPVPCEMGRGRGKPGRAKNADDDEIDVHTKGKRRSTKDKHEKGEERKKRDKAGGEKGDSRRWY